MAVITMSFPYNRETFAINEFLYLKNYCDLEVHSLRPKHKIAEQLIESYELEDIKMSHYSWQTLWRFPVNMLTHFGAFIYLLKGILQINFGKFTYLLKAVLLIPIIMDLFVQLKKNPPDIVHAYWSHYPSLIGLLGQKYLKNTRFTVCHVAHDVYLNYNLSATLKDIFDVHFSICEENVRYIQSLGIRKENIKVIYRGVPQKHLHRKLISKQQKTILSVGSLLPVKSFDLVLEVFKELKKDYEDARLIIGGDGPQKKYLLRKKGELGLEDVYFKGYLLHDEVMELMSTSEVFLLMSKNERIANVAKEAMLMQCYCIATNTPGVEELISHNSDGFIVDIGDVQAAVQIIRTIWENKATHKNIPINARQKISDKFILEQNIQEYIKIWKAIAK